MLKSKFCLTGLTFASVRAVSVVAFGLTAQLSYANPVSTAPAVTAVSPVLGQLRVGKLAYSPGKLIVPAAKLDIEARAAFQSWKRLDGVQPGLVAIPSDRPTNFYNLTSAFGVRTDPFRGTAAMHAGIDIPGPVGQAVYATADGIVSRSGWSGGYGNLVELTHGKGIQTRYGHLSVSLVQAGTSVKRGELIGRMGSTGRSTGSHLHYEVRLDGSAINPMPFMQTTNYLANLKPTATGPVQVALGGPAR